jgi:lipoprotein-anchoring transpeptidase ErfK/SrfK
MSLARRLVLVVTLAVLVSATAYGAGWASQQDPPADPLPVPVDAPAPEPTLQRTASPAGPAARAVLPAPGDRGPRVRALQARLAQIDWYQPAPTGTYDAHTTEAVRGFQAKRGLRASGTVDRRTIARLRAMTTEPTRAQLRGVLGNRPGPLDERCTTGRVLCVDKSSRTLRWVVDGEVRQTLDTRFGGPGLETREGSFSVARMSRDHVSSLYDTSMPFAMFFSGGQAVHYSPDFAAVGYAGSSHGCVNVRDHEGIAWLFDQVRLGDRVVVYRS